MKYLFFAIVLFFTGLSVATAQTESAKPVRKKTATAAAVPTNQVAQLTVAGNCGMCQMRIEKAAKEVAGVQSATWSVQHQLLSLTFDPKLTSVEAIAKAVAAAGHDSTLEKTPDTTYNDLHGCCKYTRLTETAEENPKE